MLEPDYILRQPIINYIRHYLGEITNSNYQAKLEELAESLEHSLYNKAKEHPSPSQIYMYGNNFVALLIYLKRQVEGGNKNVAEMYIEGELSCDDITCFRETLPLGPRQSTKKCFYDLLKESGLEKYAETIEDSCYRYVVERCKNSDVLICRRWDTQFKDIYYRHCATLKYYLDVTNSTNSINSLNPADYVINGLKNNTIKAEDIGFMTEKELCPSAFENESKLIEIRVNQKIDRKVSTLFKCPKCKQNKVTYEEYQSRSLDEAPDYLCECLNPLCGHRFKVCP